MAYRCRSGRGARGGTSRLVRAAIDDHSRDSANRWRRLSADETSGPSGNGDPRQTPTRIRTWTPASGKPTAPSPTVTRRSATFLVERAPPDYGGRAAVAPRGPHARRSFGSACTLTLHSLLLVAGLREAAQSRLGTAKSHARQSNLSPLVVSLAYGH